jgi:valyl-tRNA synthetase
LRLLAPFIPFATEEVWSWTHDSSIHGSAWPTGVGAVFAPDAAPFLPAHGTLLGLAGQALVGIRRAKTDAKASQKTPVAVATITGPPEMLAELELASGDLKQVGRIETLNFVEGLELAVSEIELAAPEGDAA